MSDALLRHNWHLLINPLWSPLYPLCIGIFTWLTHPSPQGELAVAHLVNLGIFLAALASFDFLLSKVIHVLGRPEGARAQEVSAPLQAWRWQLLGYSFFIFSAIGMIWTPRMMTPDLLVATFVYLDAGLLLSLFSAPQRNKACLLLGVTLGLGYLAKAFLFPMAFVFIVLAFFVIGSWKKALPALAATLLIFAVISAPLIAGISKRTGRLSYSEAGNLNYAWHVNNEQWPFFSSAVGAPAAFTHPMSLLHKNPDVFGFREPLPFTYAPRQDPYYWSAGGRTPFIARNQIRAMVRNVRMFLSDSHIAPVLALIGAALIFMAVRGGVSARLHMPGKSWPILIPGVVAPLLYLILWVEPRYVAPFLVLVLLSLLPLIPLREAVGASKASTIAAVAIASYLTILTVLLVGYHLAGFPRQEARESGYVYGDAARSLHEMGLRSGDDVGFIGDGGDGCRLARMARVRIVAQILAEDSDGLWASSDPRLEAEIFDSFVKGGATAVIAEKMSLSNSSPEWHQVGNTNFFVHFLGSPKDH